MTDEKLFRFVGAGENTPTHIPCRVFVADLRRVFEAGRQAGAASRDAEIAELVAALEHILAGSLSLPRFAEAEAIAVIAKVRNQ